MGSRSPAVYNGMLAGFAVATVVGLAGMVLAAVWDPNGNTSEMRREYGSLRPYEDPNLGGPDGMLYAEGSPVTGDGAFPTGRAQPQSPTNTDRASGPVAAILLRDETEPVEGAPVRGELDPSRARSTTTQP